jgi:hypothetical protein
MGRSTTRAEPAAVRPNAAWKRKPIVHFFALGALLFGFDRGVWASLEERWRSPEPIVIGAARVEQIRREWTRTAGRTPTPAEREALIDAEVDDELLVREARRLGYHRSDSLVRRRLARNIGFASTSPENDEAARADEALALGLDRTDLIVRRRLIQKMQLLAYEQARVSEPDDTELRAYVASHSERFRRGQRVAFVQIYLAEGPAAGDRAAVLLAALNEAGVAPDRAAEFGDPFLHGHQFAALTEVELAKRFGPAFAGRAAGLAVGGWQGPLASSYGLHLVWVRSREAAHIPELAVIRGEATEAWFAERGQRVLRNQLTALRSGVEIRVEP